MTITQKFAEFLGATRRLDGAPAEKVRAAIFDLVAAAVAGLPVAGAVAAREAAGTIWGGDAAPVWFTGRRLSAPGAAFANSAVASVLDLDDGHRAAAGHPGASIIPAVLATAAMTGANDERIITAIALGYEVAVRIAASRDFATLTTMVSGPWVGQGAAAAAAWLRGLGSEQTAQAIAIAGASAPNLAAVAYSRVMGNHLKEGIPWATATGLAAVDLSAAGFTGPTDLLDNNDFFASAKLLDGLGDRWAIEGVYFKPYSCCRWAHAAIDAILDLRQAHGLVAEDIQKIDIDTFGWALRLNNEVAPQTLESAQYSVPFCVALAATQGKDALVQLSERWLRDERTIATAQRVSLSVDPQFEAQFPSAVPARVRLTTASGVVERTVHSPLGEPTNPLSWAAIENKFASIADRTLHPADMLRFDAAIARLATGEVAPLLSELERVVHKPMPRVIKLPQ